MEKAHSTLPEIRLRDPLRDITRRERRSLLGVSLLGVAIAETGLIPSKITALGIELTGADQTSLLRLLGFVVIYFLSAFLIYAMTDFLSWCLDFVSSLKTSIENSLNSTVDADLAALKSEFTKQYLRPAQVLSKISKPASVLRAIFEFIIPIVFGVYACSSLFSAMPGTA